MRNYYDELEVSKIASKDVIEKVYKVLAKKYHPDTTKETDKQAAEEKFKIISEAYEVLSDDEKRKKYDADLEQTNPTISYEDYMNVISQRDNLNNAFNNLKNEYSQFRNSSNVNNGQYYNVNNQTQYHQQNFNNRYGQTQYQQPNFNNGYNTNYRQPNFNNGYNNQNMRQNPNPNNTKGKKYYYNTVTGQPVSSFDYFKYKIRKFFSNLVFYIVILIAFWLAIKSFTMSF